MLLILSAFDDVGDFVKPALANSFVFVEGAIIFVIIEKILCIIKYKCKTALLLQQKISYVLKPLYTKETVRLALTADNTCTDILQSTYTQWYKKAASSKLLMFIVLQVMSAILNIFTIKNLKLIHHQNFPVQSQELAWSEPIQSFSVRMAEKHDLPILCKKTQGK